MPVDVDSNQLAVVHHTVQDFFMESCQLDCHRRHHGFRILTSHWWAHQGPKMFTFRSCDR